MWVAVHTTVYTLPKYFAQIISAVFAIPLSWTQILTSPTFQYPVVLHPVSTTVELIFQSYLEYNLSGNVHDCSIQWYKILKARVPSTKMLLTFLTSALLCGSGKDAMVFTLYNGFKFYGLYIYLLFWCTTKIRTL